VLHLLIEFTDKINIRASDYRFEDKVKYYNGFVNSRGQEKQGTIITEIKELAKNKDYTESDIENRKTSIIAGFIDYLKENDLVN